MATDLLGALVHAPAGWCDPVTLADDPRGWKALIDSGDVQAGRDPLSGLLLVALTPLGASRLHVHLEETTRIELFWCPDGEGVQARPCLPTPRALRAATRAHAAALAAHADPALDHRALAEDADEWRLAADAVIPRLRPGRRRPRTSADLPLPTVLVGMSAPSYLPADEFDRHNPRAHSCGHDRPENLRAGRTCAYCAARLGPRSACPRCGNWGLDGAFARLLAAELKAMAERSRVSNM